MGQNVIGVMLGVELKKKAREKLCYEDSEGRSLIEDWNYPTSGPAPRRGDQAEWVMDSDLVGIWVVCSHGDDKGVPDLKGPISLSKLAKGKDFKRAQAAWKKFAKWVGKHGVKLGKPQLFLAPTEVA